jgi:3-methyladenine DNA glycosylase AlkD
MPDPVGDLVRLVRERLAEVADPARAEPMRAYMKSSMPYRGVTAQPLRAACRPEDSLHGREFFVRKALGWALRQHARVDPDWVHAFVAEHEARLSGLSRREALKHL